MARIRLLTILLLFAGCIHSHAEELVKIDGELFGVLRESIAKLVRDCETKKADHPCELLIHNLERMDKFTKTLTQQKDICAVCLEREERENRRLYVFLEMDTKHITARKGKEYEGEEMPTFDSHQRFKVTFKTKGEAESVCWCPFNAVMVIKLFNRAASLPRPPDVVAARYIALLREYATEDACLEPDDEDPVVEQPKEKKNAGSETGK